MKKIFIGVALSLALSSFSYAESDSSVSNGRLAYWESIDKNYAEDVSKLNLMEATAIENEKYSSPEECYVAGLFFYADKQANNKARAFRLFKRSYKMGFGPAEYMYGKMLVTGEGGNSNLYDGQAILQSVSGDYYYEQKANEFLGDEYLKKKDFNNAIAAYNRLNSRDSKYKIAKVYEYMGEKEKAYMLYKEALGSGYVEANIEMAKRFLTKDNLDTNKAIALLKSVANNGKDPQKVGEAQTLLGDIYFNGNQQRYADFDEGVAWYKKAANNGYTEALLKLHAIYTDNELDDRYRLGKNKDYIHELSEKLYNSMYRGDKL